MEKLLPDLDDDDFRGFPNEEISKSKIPDMMCAMRSFEIDEDNTEEWLQSDACEADSQHMADRHCQCCCKTKGGRRGWGGSE
jgi:hypothetical protein